MVFFFLHVYCDTSVHSRKLAVDVRPGDIGPALGSNVCTCLLDYMQGLGKYIPVEYGNKPLYSEDLVTAQIQSKC